MTCSELVRVITEYLEGTLPEDERRRFHEHLALCDPCVTYVQQMQQTIELSGTLGGGPVDPAERAARLETFRGWRATRGNGSGSPA
jgi:anti-sigma factor RsiW